MRAHAYKERHYRQNYGPCDECGEHEYRVRYKKRNLRRGCLYPHDNGPKLQTHGDCMLALAQDYPEVGGWRKW